MNIVDSPQQQKDGDEKIVLICLDHIEELQKKTSKLVQRIKGPPKMMGVTDIV